MHRSLPLSLSRLFLLIALLFCAAAPLSAADVLLLVDRVPADGLVVGRVDLTAAVGRCKTGPVVPEGIRARTFPGAQAVPFQFIPDANFDPRTRVAGTVILRLAQGSNSRLRLDFTPGKESSKRAWDGTVGCTTFSVTHNAKKMGGFPTAIQFLATGKTLEVSRWNDRLYHRELGGFCLAEDSQAKVERISAGPLCTVVRVRARYVQPGGKQPDSRPEAVYDWFYFADRPMVLVRAVMTQREPFAWHERHFLELQFPVKELPRWAAGEPVEQGRFADANKSYHGSQWGTVFDDRNAIGMFSAGRLLIHDGPGGRGTYLQARGEVAWTPWNDARQETSAWLWIDSPKEPIESMRAVAKKAPAETAVVATTSDVRGRIEAAEKEMAQAQGDARRRAWWLCSAASQLEAQGQLEEAVRAASGQMPANWTLLSAGDLGMVLRRTGEGVELLNLTDAATGRQLAAPKPLPLFSLTLRDTSATKGDALTKKDDASTKEADLVKLDADAGWKNVQIAAIAGPGIEIRWQEPTDERLAGLRVVATAVASATEPSIRWTLKVDGAGKRWSVWRVVFPQVAVADLGPGASVFFPKAAGEVQQNVWQRDFSFRGTYPAGWTSMQFLAAYSQDQKTGLYVAVHDPWASTKDIQVQSKPSQRAVVFSFDHPTPDMGNPGNRFELSGEAVWRLLRGDWFDAAVAYRDWVRREARWYPKLTADGRADTPQWMRELPVWALSGGAPKECVESVKKFAQYLGVPCGFHWYSWHKIPFDNDYPHYFPTKDGFADGVRELQAAGVQVMPYINGRLWDTRDKGMEDFEFTKIARPAVTKDEKGEPYLESYSSKEADGSRVRLGVMCPTTELWRTRQREIVLRLFNECGVRGVYIDQVAAARPVLCFDRSHGHPLGGGHWWTEGYWRLLDAIRKAKPQDRMLTTECNGEPYIHSFDGYLTWHWQYDGQVPAFPAVYGGSIQMFGRSYGGGPTRDLALRMRAGQQLVFGEQIGWIGPGVIHEKANAEFLRQVVRLRWRLRRYFYAGEMARPPKLVGNVPTVRADWKWGGTMWVTTDSVLTGAWVEPAKKRLVLLFANVSDQPVTARVRYDTGPYGLGGPSVRVAKTLPDGVGESFDSPSLLDRKVTFPGQTAWAWEITASHQ